MSCVCIICYFFVLIQNTFIEVVHTYMHRLKDIYSVPGIDLREQDMST